jgi:putative transposase
MGYLRLSRIVRDIPIRLHRAIPKDAIVKQVTIKHASSGKWYAYAILESEHPINTKSIDYRKHIGLDVGIINYIYDSDGQRVPHPHNIEAAREELAEEQRRLARKQKGLKNKVKQRVRVARVHETVANRRADFLHKTSAYYVKHYDVIGRENLSIQGLIKISRNARNLTDAAFGRLFNMIAYKAETACKLVIEVKAPYSSIECSGCHKMVEKTLAVRTHDCPYCGLKIDRDYNASRIVDYRALQILGLEESELSMPAEMEPLLIRDNEQILSMKQELLQCASGEAQGL